MFRPQPHQRLQIGRHVYRFEPHPMSPGFVYGQEGRMAVVYKLSRESTTTSSASGRERALKVFKAAYRTPQIEQKAQELRPFAQIGGLQACARRVLSPGRPEYQAVLHEHPDLEYAVLMPWVPGLTWSDIMLQRRPLAREQVWGLAWALLNILLELERRGMAHCDLSGANFMVHWTEQGPMTALVDVEQLYAPGLSSPDALLVGSPGYTPPFGRENLWGPLGDRFAGAILLSEILGWYDPRVAEYGSEQSYFPSQEIQADSARYRLLLQALHRWHPHFAQLLRQVWEASSLEELPSFQTWQHVFLGRPLPAQPRRRAPAPPEPAAVAEQPRIASPQEDDVNAATSVRADSEPYETGAATEVASPRDAPSEEPLSTYMASYDVGATEVATQEDAAAEPPPASSGSDALHEAGDLPTQVADEDDIAAAEGFAGVAPAPPAAPRELPDDATVMVEEEIPAQTPSQQVASLWSRARKAAGTGLREQALEFYRRALDIATENRHPRVSTLLHEYNVLIFRQIETLKRVVYSESLHAGPMQTLRWTARLGSWMAGLSGGQLALLAIGIAVGAFVLMSLLASWVHHPIIGLFSATVFALAVLLSALSSPLLIMGLYSAAVLFGLWGLVANPAGENPALLGPLVMAFAGSGAASFFLQWLRRSEENASPRLQALIVVATALLVGMSIDELAYPGAGTRLMDLKSWLINFVVALGGWYIGTHLREILIAYRESFVK